MVNLSLPTCMYQVSLRCTEWWGRCEQQLQAGLDHPMLLSYPGQAAADSKFIQNCN